MLDISYSPNSASSRRLSHLTPPLTPPRVAALTSILCGIVVLAGWVFGIDTLKRLAPHFVAMSPMTASSAILAGLALFIFDLPSAPRGWILLARAAAAAVALVGLLRILGYIIGFDFGLDRLLFPDRLFEPTLQVSNRIAPNTAANMFLAASAILLVSLRRPALRQTGQILAAIVAMICLLSLIGYVYNANQLYGVANYVPMALHTALVYLVLAGGTLFVRPGFGFMRIALSRGAGGVLARRLIPAVIFIPVFLGWLSLRTQAAGLYTPEFAAAIRVVITILILLGLVWWTAATLFRVNAQRRNAESALAAATDAALAANRAKSDFLANMSHEIRTPMTAIIGYTDLLLEPDQCVSERLNHINVVRRNAEYLLAIVNDILDISKIEAGQLVTERVATDPCQIIREVASMMRVRALERKIDLLVRLDGPVPSTIHSDPTRLRQILINLVGNAIKFTETGHVRITAKLLDSPQSADPRLAYEIADTGIGISPQDAARLFQPFTQAEASTARRFGGTGLGLAISKRLAESLGGTITLDSNPGHGSTFTVTVGAGSLAAVPMVTDWEEVAQEKTDPRASNVKLNGRILLAEDGSDNRQLLSYYLVGAGADVTTAENGRIAVEKALAATQAGQPFDVILMDMRMPELDGYGAAAKLRARGYAKPIVALTAHAMAGDRDKCLQSGCTDYLTKPVSKAALLDMVLRHLTAGVHSMPGATGPIPITSAPLDDEVRQFLPTFIAHLPVQVARLCDTLRRKDTARPR